MESVPARALERREADGGVEDWFCDAEVGARLVEFWCAEDTVEVFGGEGEVRVVASSGECEAVLGDVGWDVGEAYL